MFKVIKRILRTIIAIICATGMLAILFVAYYYFLGQDEVAVPGQTLQVNMYSGITPTVHYRDNFIFEPGPQPSGNIQYLTYFTEYVEAKSSFRATFSRPVDVAYRFLATATLTIRREGGGIVYQQLFLLEEEFEDVDSTRLVYNFRLQQARPDDLREYWNWHEEDHPYDWDHNPEDDWGRHVDIMMIEGGLPGGVVYIDLDEFMEIVQELIEEIAMGVGMLLNATSEIEVEFSHRIFVKNYGIDETITRGIVIPLRRDAFTMSTTGTPSRTVTGRLDPRAVIEGMVYAYSTPDAVVELLELLIDNEYIPETLIIYLAALLLPLFALGFYFSIGGGRLVRWTGRKMRPVGERVFDFAMKPIKDMSGSHDRKVKKLLKKYPNEIIVVESSMHRDDLGVSTISDFAELLKLSLFTNHPIFCYHNKEGKKRSEFSVIFEGFVHSYVISEEKEAEKESDEAEENTSV